jgi:hypothetical protein
MYNNFTQEKKQERSYGNQCFRYSNRPMIFMFWDDPENFWDDPENLGRLI